MDWPHKALYRANRKLSVLTYADVRRIVSYLSKRKGDYVTPIYQALDLEQCVASRFLNMLEEQGYVTSEREGKRVFYSLNVDEFARIIPIVDKLNRRSHR